MTRTGETD